MADDQPPTSSPREGSTDYTQYGITDIPKYTTLTAFGKTKTFAGLYPKEWAFLVVSTINILAAVGLTIYRLVVVVESDPESSDFTFTILLLINAGFSAFYVIHGVLHERVYELYALIVAILVVTMYCVLEYGAFNKEGQTTVKLVRLILVCILAPPNIFLAWAVAKDFGYLEFRIVGASEYLQHLYKQASIFSCFLKLDLQASVSFVVLALKEGTDITLLEKINLGVGIPYTLLWSILGWFVVRELRVWAWVFAVAGVVKPAYYLYKVIKVYTELAEDHEAFSNTIVYSLLAAGAIALISWFILMAELIVVYRNFGKGLRERAFEVLATENSNLLTGRRSRWQ
ncbi:uncharacterized protein LOC124283453 [Haliotis rubra]|uniref:uncharacterized protein LOC124283453 n=1 Tax=Haliotis rubra TaxID=36100 RepID=UPI001EE618CC|nr:uncharacterized protein LOC124283453 [Haliotis rubra]